jgi:hypothetical protein
MPLLDHFRSPTFEAAPWTSIGSQWIAWTVRWLNRTLPDRGFRAFSHIHLGNMAEADIGEFEREPEGVWAGSSSSSDGTQTAVLPPPVGVIEPVYPDEFEIEIKSTREGMRLVAVIEFISPSNKDRADARKKLIDKCAAYLGNAIGVVLVDTITHRHFNLSNELVATIGGRGPLLTDATTYVAAFRPSPPDVSRSIDVWPYKAEVGLPIPAVPLPLPNGPELMLDLETPYTEACNDHGL